MIEELRQNWASHVSADLMQPLSSDTAQFKQQLDKEISERMSGNICRCSAYTNIVRAIKQVLQETGFSAETDNVATQTAATQATGVSL